MSFRKRGSSSSRFQDVSGSSTHGSLRTEPSFKALHARPEQTGEGISQQSPRNPHPTTSYPIMQGRGTQDTCFHYPLEFGPNYEHTLAGDGPHYGHSVDGARHFKKGGRARGEVVVEYGSIPRKASGGNWIQNAVPPSSRGKLHEHLGVPAGKKIPMKKIKKAEHSSNPTLAREAHLAETLRKFHHH
jgi:hypothetical protein